MDRVLELRGGWMTSFSFPFHLEQLISLTKLSRASKIINLMLDSWGLVFVLCAYNFLNIDKVAKVTSAAFYKILTHLLPRDSEDIDFLTSAAPSRGNGGPGWLCRETFMVSSVGTVQAAD